MRGEGQRAPFASGWVPSPGSAANQYPVNFALSSTRSDQTNDIRPTHLLSYCCRPPAAISLLSLPRHRRVAIKPASLRPAASASSCCSTPRRVPDHLSIIKDEPPPAPVSSLAQAGSAHTRGSFISILLSLSGFSYSRCRARHNERAGPVGHIPAHCHLCSFRQSSGPLCRHVGACHSLYSAYGPLWSGLWSSR